MRVGNSPASKLNLSRQFLASLLSLLMIAAPATGQTSDNGVRQERRRAFFQVESQEEPSVKTGTKSEESRKPEEANGANGAHQAGLCGLDRVAADGPATGHAAHAGGLCGSDQVCAAAHAARLRLRLIWRWGTPICWTSATPRRRPTFAWPGRPATCWPTTRTFWAHGPTTRPATNPTAEALLHGFSDRYPDSIFVAQAPELEANVLLAMNDAASAQRVLAAAAGTAAANRPGYQLAQGQVAFALGADAEGGADLQAAAAGPSAEPGGGDCAGKADRHGRGDQPDDGRVAQPGRCLLQRRPLRRRQREQYRALARAVRASTPEPQRLCRGRGGLRPEAEAADRRPRPKRCPTRRTRTARGGSTC